MIECDKRYNREVYYSGIIVGHKRVAYYSRIDWHNTNYQVHHLRHDRRLQSPV